MLSNLCVVFFKSWHGLVRLLVNLFNSNELLTQTIFINQNFN